MDQEEPCQIFDISQLMDFGFLFCPLLWWVKKSLQLFTGRDKPCKSSWINFRLFAWLSCIKIDPNLFLLICILVFSNPLLFSSAALRHSASAMNRMEKRNFFIVLHLSNFSVSPRQTIDCFALLGNKKFSSSTFCLFHLH